MNWEGESQRRGLIGKLLERRLWTASCFSKSAREKKELGVVVDWSKIDRDAYLQAMERSPVRDAEIKELLKGALTDHIHDQFLFMKGIDASYHYEGYHIFRTEDLIRN